MMNVNVDKFREYLISDYDHTKPIIPWGIQVKGKMSEALGEWQKKIKPNCQDYKEFRDEKYWFLHKSKILTTLKAQGLSHLVDPKYREPNKSLEEAQFARLYKVFQDIMIESDARDIVLDHEDDKDCRQIWTEICSKYDSSLVAKMYAHELSTYITSVRLHQINWRGTHKAFILNYKEQTRQHGLLAEEAFTDSQHVDFLHAAVCEIEHFKNVLTTDRAARRAVGNTSKITFSEFVTLLCDAAAVHDAKRYTNRGR